MSSSGHRPYQGYPYINPPVFDAPSIDPVTAARWTHLPKRQIGLSSKNVQPTSSKNDEEDLELASGSKRPTLLNKSDEDNPVVYIDIPEAHGSPVSEDRRNSIDFNGQQSSQSRPKHDRGDEPILYINIPEGDGREVTRAESEEAPYVQDTIFYDPFENRRIDEKKAEPSVESDSDDTTSSGSTKSRPRRPAPIHPQIMNHPGAGQPGTSSRTGMTSTPGLSPMMSKETMVYGRETSNDRFPISPIPISQFPEPPPAYTEVDDRVTSPTSSEPTRNDPVPPRTQVILPGGTPAVLPVESYDLDRKYLSCSHCQLRVHTLVVKEVGLFTHATAVCCIVFCLFPIVPLIYCTDYFKVKNHYCPSCNKNIAYQIPLRGETINYIH